ncbi:coronin, partial [Ascoidea rubescens DSM 1968]
SRRFVRASKYRHVFAQPSKKELCYENLRISKNAWDSNLLKVNSKFLSVNWDSSGGGAFAVIPLNQHGKAPDQIPLFRGHTAPVLDTDFDPFNDHIVASCSEDGKIFIYNIPEDYSFHLPTDPKNKKNSDPQIKDIYPSTKLSGHTRKVGHIRFHPIAQNILVSSSMDYTIKIWNTKTAKVLQSLKHNDAITSFSFNYNGDLLASVSRDKKLRIWNIRTGALLQEGPCHGSPKVSRVYWLGKSNRVVTTGFSRLSDRQFALWDTNNIQNGPINGFHTVDVSSGILVPFFDESTSILLLAGKGDGNIRYYEYDPKDDRFYDISEFQSIEPQRGFAIAPKRSVNIKENEIIKAYKTVNDNFIEPISFIVPRRSEVFQYDIYPDCPSQIPALSLEDYLNNKSVNGPVLMNMESLFENDDPIYTNARSIESNSIQSNPIQSQLLSKKVQSNTPSPINSSQNSSNTSLSKTKLNDLLEKKEVNDLINKATDLDNENEVQFVSSNWDDKKPSPKPTPIVAEKIPEKASPKSASTATPKNMENKPLIETVPEKSHKIEPNDPKKTEKNEKNDTNDKTESIKPSLPTGGATNKALALKEIVSKLSDLITKFETEISLLKAINSEKDKRLQALEEKIDLLLSNQN